MKRTKVIFSAAVICAAFLFAILPSACSGEEQDSRIAAQPLITTAAADETTAARTATTRAAEASASAASPKKQAQSRTQPATGATAAGKSNAATRFTINEFMVLNQLPELPTGCEVTSLTMVLNHLGYSCTKLELADNYLAKGVLGQTDPRRAFIGDPASETDSRGCYAPVVADTANKYLTAQGAARRAEDISGNELETLFRYIQKGTPVIVWGTMDCAPVQPTDVWEIDGQTIQWLRPEHCMVLVGYDDTQIFEADPYYATVKPYDIETFRTAYNGLHRQAVVIE